MIETLKTTFKNSKLQYIKKLNVSILLKKKWLVKNIN